MLGKVTGNFDREMDAAGRLGQGKVTDKVQASKHLYESKGK